MSRPVREAPPAPRAGGERSAAFTSKDPNPRDARGPWFHRLRIALPLAAGLGLVGLFVVLLLKHSEVARSPGHEVKRGSFPIHTSNSNEIPLGSPTDPTPPPPPPGEGLKRWSLEKLPPGWDPELAHRLALYFGAMDVTAADKEEKMKHMEEVREELRAFLAGLGPEAIPTLTAILNAEVDFVDRRFLLYALGALGPRSDEATVALLDFYTKIKSDQRARSETNHVIEAMKSLRNDSAFQVMNGMIDDPSTPVYDKDKFIQALGEHPRRKEAVPRIVKELRESEDLNVRNHSAQALGKIQSGEALPELISQFNREPIWQVRQTILGSIGKIADPSALTFLEKQALTAEPSDVRLSAAAAIRRIWQSGTARAQRILRSVHDAERDEAVSAKIREWLEER